jgi:hypothetical protein
MIEVDDYTILTCVTIDWRKIIAKIKILLEFPEQLLEQIKTKKRKNKNNFQKFELQFRVDQNDINSL